MLRVVICTALVLFSSPTFLFAQAVTHIVDDDGGGTAANCDDATPGFATVAAAIAAAGSGDTVLVCPGTYVENINFGGKAIAVRSISGAATTILDGNAAGSVVTFNSGETANSVLEGFTIRNALATSVLDHGGGIAIDHASPVIRRNVIVGNRACSEPGIGVHFGSPLIEENRIANNTQAGCSGAEGGGGIGIRGTSTAVIRRNTISNNDGGSSGGGISLNGVGSPTIDSNVIWGNSSYDRGGGISLANDSSPTITGNLIVRNRAQSGGGIFWRSPTRARPVLVNNTIAENDGLSGSGIFAEGYDDVGATLFNNNIIAAAGQTAVFCRTTNPPHPPPTFRFNNVFSATRRELCGHLRRPDGTERQHLG